MMFSITCCEMTICLLTNNGAKIDVMKASKQIKKINFRK